MTISAGASVDETAKSLLEGIVANEQPVANDHVEPVTATEQEQEADVDQEVQDDQQEPEVLESSHEDDEGIEPPEEPELYTVTVNGVDQQVTHEELTQGYSRREDYTRKTQNLAEDRRKMESEQSLVASDRTKYVDGLSQVQAALETLESSNSNQDLLGQLERGEITAAEYTVEQERSNQRQAQIQVLKDERAREDTADRAKRINQEFAILKRDRPDLVTDAKTKEVQDFITRPVDKGGMGLQTLMAFDNAQMLMIAADAMEYRKAKQTIKKKPPKQLSPGTKQTPRSPKGDRQRKLDATAKNSGRVDDVAKSLERMFQQG